MFLNSTSCQNVYDVFFFFLFFFGNIQHWIKCLESILAAAAMLNLHFGTKGNIMFITVTCTCFSLELKNKPKAKIWIPFCQFKAASWSTVSLTYIGKYTLWNISICTVCELYDYTFIFMCSAVIQIAREHHSREKRFSPFYHAKEYYKKMNIWLQNPAWWLAKKRGKKKWGAK